jgi:MFS family permease
MAFKLAFRRLLEIDQPVPSRSDEEITAEIERNYRWNFTVNLLDGTAFWFGLSFLSATTIVPLFVSKLTESPFVIGLVAVIAQGSWFLPQLFTANAVERLARKKPVVINLGFFLERIPFWIIVVAAMLAARSPELALILFLISYAWRGFGAGIVATAWQDLIASIFPVERRGRFFGTTMFAGAALGAAGASLSAWVLKRYPFPTNFVFLFAAAAAAITISWLFLALTREPVQAVTAPRQSNRQFWAELPRIVRQDHNFRRFLVGRLLLAMGEMGFGFVTVAAIQRWAVPDSTVGIYTASYLVGQTIGNLSFGFLADKRGHLLSLELTGLAAMLSFGLAWLAPAPGWYYLVFVLLGIAVGGIIVSGILVVLEFCPPEKRPTYTGLTNTGAGLVGVAAPLIGAWLASHSYSWLFGLGAAINLLAFAVLHWWVQEPRQANDASNAKQQLH